MTEPMICFCENFGTIQFLIDGKVFNLSRDESLGLAKLVADWRGDELPAIPNIGAALASFKPLRWRSLAEQANLEAWDKIISDAHSRLLARKAAGEKPVLAKSWDEIFGAKP